MGYYVQAFIEELLLSPLRWIHNRNVDRARAKKKAAAINPPPPPRQW